MGQIEMAGSGGGGVTSDDVTVVKAHVLKGERTITADSNDEIAEGDMTVNSLLSFNVAAYSGRRMLASWKNPKQAAGRPYSGVIIEYATGAYPAKGKGTRIYKGAGNNSASEGQSSVYIDLPSLGSTYYFICYPYVTANIGDLLGDELKATAKTGATINVTIKATQNYTIPVGYATADIFCVGGGGKGGYGTAKTRVFSGGGGAGGGYTKTVTASVAAGQVLNCTVGSGGSGTVKEDGHNVGGRGGTTSVSRNGTMLCNAEGGHGGWDGYQPNQTSDMRDGKGGNGGSGGGSGADYDSRYNELEAAGAGGSNGGNGGAGFHGAGVGQGTTTKAFGESSGTVYAGGGGGGGIMNNAGGTSTPGGTGGPNGGGSGNISNGNNGTANTGGGGGGGGAKFGIGADSYGGGSGGSGVILIRLR